jgi:hypothetical protein
MNFGGGQANARSASGCGGLLFRFFCGLAGSLDGERLIARKKPTVLAIVFSSFRSVIPRK